MKGIRVLFLCAAATLSFAAMAAKQGLDLQQVREQQAEIRAGVMARSGPYKDMPDNTRTELLDKQNRLLAIIEGKQDAAELNDNQRVEAFNLLEWIEGAVNSTGDERMVCERTRKTGSNRTTRVCRTERQWREARERARRQMEGSMPVDI